METLTPSSPALSSSGTSLLSVFNGSNPNGAWQLFVQDDFAPESGNIASWALQIIAEVDVLVEEQVPVKNKKKGKKGKGRRQSLGTVPASYDHRGRLVRPNRSAGCP